MGFGVNFAEAFGDYVARLPAALLVTFVVTAGAGAIGLSLGLLLALARLSHRRLLSRVAEGLTYVIRAVPVPPFMYLVYFIILGTLFRIEQAHAGMLALGILLAPYMAELYRSGIQSVRKGHVEAGLALGMSMGLVRRRIVLPIALRIMLPAIGQLLVGTLLNSAFVAVMGGVDVTGMARKIINSLFSTELWFVVAITYFVIAYPISRALSYLERRLKMAM